MSPSPPVGDPSSDRIEAMKLVKAPAMAIKVLAVVSLIFQLAALVIALFSLHPQTEKVPGGTFGFYNDITQSWANKSASDTLSNTIFTTLVSLPFQALMYFGAASMQSLRRYNLSLVSIITSMIPCYWSLCGVGIPIGIWAIIVLNRKEIRTQFT